MIYSYHFNCHIAVAIYTHALQDHVFCHVEGTMSLRRIATVLKDNHLSFFLQRCRLFDSAKCGDTTELCPTFEEFCKIIGVGNLYTNHSVIAAAYLQTFSKMERVYDTHMQGITMDEDRPYLSCDHTFRSAGLCHALM